MVHLDLYDSVWQGELFAFSIKRDNHDEVSVALGQKHLKDFIEEVMLNYEEKGYFEVGIYDAKSNNRGIIAYYY